MAEQKVIDKAKAWADKEYDELRYSKCEKKRFVFTFHELREMGKQAFIAGHEAGADELRKELEDAKKTQVVEHFEAYGQCRDSRRIAALDAKLERAREIIGELQGILDKDICKDCDGGLHCSECYVNHAITTAGTFLEEYKK